MPVSSILFGRAGHTCPIGRIPQLRQLSRTLSRGILPKTILSVRAHALDLPFVGAKRGVIAVDPDIARPDSAYISIQYIVNMCLGNRVCFQFRPE